MSSFSFSSSSPRSEFSFSSSRPSSMSPFQFGLTDYERYQQKHSIKLRQLFDELTQGQHSCTIAYNKIKQCYAELSKELDSVIHWSGLSNNILVQNHHNKFRQLFDELLKWHNDNTIAYDNKLKHCYVELDNVILYGNLSTNQENIQCSHENDKLRKENHKLESECKRLNIENEIQSKLIMKGSKMYENKVQCIICREATSTHAFVPCGHRCVCKDCTLTLEGSMNQCPICRESYENVIQIYD